VEAPVVELLAGPEASRNQEGVHGGSVLERVVWQDREARLGLHGTEGVGDQEGVELRIESSGHGKDSVGRGEIDDLGVLENVDAEAKSGRVRLLRHGVLRLDCPIRKFMTRSAGG
jgi:hypothetical protein